MTFRFAAVAAVAFFALVFAWSAWPPEISLRIEPGSIAPRDGYAFVSTIIPPAYLPAALIAGDDLANPERSGLQVFEDWRPLGPPHSVHDEISKAGSGRYSHWLDSIIFSASDNSDPRSNGRVYQARARVAPPTFIVVFAAAAVFLLAGIGLFRARRLPTRRTVLRAVATVGIVTAIGIFAWALFPPQGVWRIAANDISPNTGRSFMTILANPALAPFASVRSDNADASKVSGLRLYQDGKLLGPPHAVHALVSDIGAGLYSHWGEAIIFSSHDNSDPRTNGRIYEARAPVEPAHWLILCAAAVLLSALGFGWRRLLQAREVPWSERWLRAAAAAPAMAFVVVAGMATISLLGVFRGERVVSATELSPDAPQAVLDLADRVSRNGVYVLEFPRFFAPFLEIGCCSRFEMRRGETPILLGGEFDPQPGELRPLGETILVRPDNRFYDFEDYLYLHLRVAPQWHEVFTLRFPIKAEPELIAALWLSAIGMIILRRRMTRFLLQPTPAAFLRGAAAVSASVGVALLVINAIGLFMPLRYGEVDHPSRATINRSYGPGDATLTWEAARTQLAPGATESRAAYAHRLTNVVAQSIMHYWYERDRRAFRLQVPIWENYLLWLAGEVRPEYRLYAFADPYKAIERGTGMCDQVSSALSILLRRQGLDARLVQLNGHTVVTVEVNPGDWHVLDADFNVVIPKSIAQIQAEPNVVRPYYQAAFNRLDSISSRISVDQIASYYAPPTYIGEAGANAALGEQRVRFEALAYWLKWRLPLMLLALAMLVAVGLNLAESPTGRLATIRRLFHR